ncbi:Winged helix DNA-binding domain-containing protein [Dyadobacter koreensis]|uniref:Winged helix DNA-binding domain-containing protein n=1 Tax=Dyadobacter koreensis TaxID=408657 RepID=A0A1H6VB52_9BACT|nr:winged helix DNA-binding domain-containing protein [Dyadobacter koreensis]SEI97465.1 Winged helix DNA-binding domain-containing protein [Dyadobacter koreensis]
MDTADIIRLRLVNQKITHSDFTRPDHIVKYMVAMQAQEYAMAKWAIGLRVPGTTDESVEEAFNEGRILRTHLMRPTWHFVAPEDIRWMIALTAPRVNAINAFMYRKCEIDAQTFNTCNDILIKELEGGKSLTRNALKEKLDKKIVTGDSVRLGCLMMKAELDNLICSGPRDGKQFTYALIDERVPAAKPLTHEEAVIKLTSQYFTSRGPAQLQDFVMWSGLTVKDVKAGIAALSNDFVHEKFKDKIYIYSSPVEQNNSKTKSTFLMPDYDEYGMSYKDRSAIFVPTPDILKNFKLNIPYNRMIVSDGEIVGSWKRTVTNKGVNIETEYFKKLKKKEEENINIAIKKFSGFIGKSIAESDR